MADNPITTPLPADLPEQWTYGQTVGPNGTDVGLTEQHGYNYLMRQVNATQEGVNALGEAFAEVPVLEGGKVPVSQLPVGTPNGVAGLDSAGKVPSSQLPDMDYVPLSGGTMTGPLTLSGDPAEDLQAAPKQYVDKLGLPIVTTEGDGAAYTATVPGITALTAGASFIMIPHTVSTTTNPTLNVNNLGAKNIKRGLSTISTSNSIGNSSNWLSVGRPLLMVYDGLLWKVVNMTKPVAADLDGTLPVVNGGTGYNTFADSTYTAARYRASALYNTETAPTVNGVINWTYE